MWHITFLVSIALVWIVFASIEDLKKREVANWLNFSLIIFALGFRFFYSLFSDADFNFFYQGLIGFVIFMGLGNIFYYGRVFAGGDAKLMIALGTILPLADNFKTNLGIFISFLLLFFFIGALYGLAVSASLTLKNFKKFKKEFRKQFRERKTFIMVFLVIGFGVLLLGLFNGLFFVLGGMIFISPYFYLYAKSIDKACMIKNIDSKKLTEGDWLYQDVKIGKEIINASWHGVSQEQINKIQKNFKKVKIRQGIPFVPVFLISFIAFLVLYYLGYVNMLFFLKFYF